jgi:fido (protein-threonine AMPylation protein)
MKKTGVIYETAFGRVDSSAGDFRKGSVFAGKAYFPAFDKVPRYTKDLAEAIILAIPHSVTLQQKIDLCFISHYNLTSVHPFYDGNGRTSRLLMNFLLHYFGLPLATVFPESKEEYYQSLQQARAQEQIKPFLEFMYLQYKRFLKTTTLSY